MKNRDKMTKAQKDALQAILAGDVTHSDYDGIYRNEKTGKAIRYDVMMNLYQYGYKFPKESGPYGWHKVLCIDELAETPAPPAIPDVKVIGSNPGNPYISEKMPGYNMDYKYPKGCDEIAEMEIKGMGVISLAFGQNKKTGSWLVLVYVNYKLSIERSMKFDTEDEGHSAFNMAIRVYHTLPEIKIPEPSLDDIIDNKTESGMIKTFRMDDFTYYVKEIGHRVVMLSTDEESVILGDAPVYTQLELLNDHLAYDKIYDLFQWTSIDPVYDPQLLFDVFITALEGGINYWAMVHKYKHQNPNGGEDLNGFSATVSDVEEDGPLVTFEINKETIIKGFSMIMDPEFKIANDLREDISNAIKEKDGSYIDASGADAVVQAGIFDEIVFG
jgi:hypothetical protein